MKRKLLTAMLPIVLLLATCKKTSKPYWAIDPVIKKSYAFKTGSYWVYKERYTGAIDSCYVWTSSDGTSETPDDTHEEFRNEVRMINDIAGHIEEWDFAMDGAVANSGIGLSFYNNQDKIEDQLHNLGLFTSHIQVDSQDTTECEVMSGLHNGVYRLITKIESIYNSYNVDGINYANVVQIHYWSEHDPYSTSTSISNPSIKFDDYVFMSPNIGIVKIIFNHPQDTIYRELDLLRYKTITY